MSQLYQANNKYIVLNPHLSQLALDSLNHGEILDVDISVRDGRKLSDRQRKFFYALCEEIGNERGEHKDYIEIEAKNNYFQETGKDISLKEKSDTTMTEGKKLIEILINFNISHGFLPDFRTLEDNKYNFTTRQIYTMCLKRICCVCGGRADLHHMNGSTVGMGRNRNKISHVGAGIIPLCRTHHTEFHAIGEAEFMDLYHVEPAVVDEKLDKLIRGGKIR